MTKQIDYSEFRDVCEKLRVEKSKHEKTSRILRKAKDMFWKFCKFKKYDRRKQMCEFDRRKHFVCNKENRQEKCPFYIVLKD